MRPLPSTMPEGREGELIRLIRQQSGWKGFPDAIDAHTEVPRDAQNRMMRPTEASLVEYYSLAKKVDFTSAMSLIKQMALLERREIVSNYMITNLNSMLRRYSQEECKEVLRNGRTCRKSITMLVNDAILEDLCVHWEVSPEQLISAFGENFFTDHAFLSNIARFMDSDLTLTETLRLLTFYQDLRGDKLFARALKTGNDHWRSNVVELALHTTYPLDFEPRKIHGFHHDSAHQRDTIRPAPAGWVPYDVDGFPRPVVLASNDSDSDAWTDSESDTWTDSESDAAPDSDHTRPQTAHVRTGVDGVKPIKIEDDMGTDPMLQEKLERLVYESRYLSLPGGMKLGIQLKDYQETCRKAFERRDLTIRNAWETLVEVLNITMRPGIIGPKDFGVQSWEEMHASIEKDRLTCDKSIRQMDSVRRQWDVLNDFVQIANRPSDVRRTTEKAKRRPANQHANVRGDIPESGDTLRTNLSARHSPSDSDDDRSGDDKDSVGKEESAREKRIRESAMTYAPGATGSPSVDPDANAIISNHEVLPPVLVGRNPTPKFTRLIQGQAKPASNQQKRTNNTDASRNVNLKSRFKFSRPFVPVRPQRAETETDQFDESRAGTRILQKRKEPAGQSTNDQGRPKRLCSIRGSIDPLTRGHSSTAQ